MTATHEIKSLVVKEKNKEGKEVTWGVVFYDSVKNKTFEKELIAHFKQYKDKTNAT
jgi:hypothetical protein